jgi:6-pyruvoyl-tetrahydropterin synthase
MKVTSTFEFMFSAAVRLPGATGPKKHLHGHNYRLQVVLRRAEGEAAAARRGGAVADGGPLRAGELSEP